jgi:hypothetical protein
VRGGLAGAPGLPCCTERYTAVRRRTTGGRLKAALAAAEQATEAVSGTGNWKGAHLHHGTEHAAEGAGHLAAAAAAAAAAALAAQLQAAAHEVQREGGRGGGEASGGAAGEGGGHAGRVLPAVRQPGGAHRLVCRVVYRQAGGHLQGKQTRRMASMWGRALAAMRTGKQAGRGKGTGGAQKDEASAAEARGAVQLSPGQYLQQGGPQPAVQPPCPLVRHDAPQRLPDARVVALRGLRRQPRAHQVKRVGLGGRGGGGVEP